jgi:hypothetical protein
MSTLDLELFGNGFDAIPLSVQHPGGIQDYHDVARAEQPGDSQQLGWLSPSASQFVEGLQDGSRDKASPFGPAVEDHPVEPSKEDLAVEVAHLKAMVAVMSDRLNQAETSPAPKTPPQQAQPVRPQTTPQKRTASRVADTAASPTKPPQHVAPSQVHNTQGPIEAMWSPGVTSEQRRAIFDSSMHSTASNTGAMCPPSFTTPKTTSPAAKFTPSSTPTRKPAPKRARTSAPKKTPAPKRTAKTQPRQVQYQHQRSLSTPTLPSFTGVDIEALNFLTSQTPRPVDRPISELYQTNFMSLGLGEKARILLPLLVGNDPETGMKWAEPGSLGRELLASAAQTGFPGDFGSDPFTSSMHPLTDPAASDFQSIMSSQTTSTEASTEQASIPSYSNFNRWVNSLKAPITQTATEQASSDDQSDNNLTTFQAPNEQASLLSKSDINSLLSYTQGDAVEAPAEQNSYPDTFNFEMKMPSSNAQDVNVLSAYNNSPNNLLHGFSAQTNIDGPFAFDNAEPAPQDFFTTFIHEDTTTATEDSFALTNNALTGQGPFTSSNIESDTQDPFVLINENSDFFNFDHATDNTTGMSAGLTPNANFDFDTIFNNADADLSHMVQEATAQIQAPDSGAMRQREALMEHERRVAEGRRR